MAGHYYIQNIVFNYSKVFKRDKTRIISHFDMVLNATVYRLLVSMGLH